MFKLPPMLKLPPTLSIHLLWQNISLRTLRLINLGIIICMAAGFLCFWQPAYLRLGSLQQDKTHWQDLLSQGMTESDTVIPAMDQLPEMIELCRKAFEHVGVDVVSFNVERFGERREAGKGARLDYALVRMRLAGQWEGIVRSVETLEKLPEAGIQAQEVVLAEEGGEVLLQIYFGTGM